LDADRGIAQDAANVVVGEQEPRPERRLMHGIRRAELRVMRVRVGGVPVGERVEEDGGLRHSALLSGGLAASCTDGRYVASPRGTIWCPPQGGSRARLRAQARLSVSA